ncbi:MAG: hypothetical protein N4A62_16700 [Marinisporobacter sp.]|nr:hypothetical protein [Marinisporobacter sp.]
MCEKKELSKSKNEQDVKKVQVDIHKTTIQQCDGSKITANTTPLCMNTPEAIDVIHTGVIAQIPVVLAQLTVQINMNTFIELPELIYEIREIRNKIKVTQSVIVQDTNMLFIKGKIKKHIDYIPSGVYTNDCIYRKLKQCIVEIPFNCTTKVIFNGNVPLKVDTNKRDQLNVEFYDELPYCRLVNSKIVENNRVIEDGNLKGTKDDPKESVFRKIEENMVIFLTFKILQKQQVKIPVSSVIDLGININGCF